MDDIMIELANFIGLKIKEDNSWFLHTYYDCGLVEINFHNKFICSIRNQTNFIQKNINSYRVFKISNKENFRQYLGLE